MRLIDFFFALRPMVLVPAWSFVIVGYGLARADGATPFPSERFCLLTLVLVATYLINQVVDYESDRLNDKGFFLQRGIFSRRLYVVAAIACLALALATAWVRQRSPELLLASAFLGVAYSLPPARLVARPGIDLVANGVGYGCLALLLGAGDAWAWSAAWGARLGAGFLAVATVFVHTTLLDLDGDRKSGKRTLGVALGRRRARLLAMGLGLGCVASAWWSGSSLLIAACAALAAASVGAATTPRWLSSRTLCVGGTGLFVVVAGVYAPAFLVCIVALTFLTRLYYRRRFALAYPSL